MAGPFAHVRFRAAVLLPATLTATILGCSGLSPPSPNPHLVAAPSASGAAARAFLSKLDESQRVDASVSFDDPQRINWSYVPQERAGIPLRAMDADQRDAALGLLNLGLSERGTRLARGIMELEGTLRELEQAVDSPWAARRDPGLYYLTIFGHPDGGQPWGWRFEGHHLSVNATDLGPHGEIVAPLFMGANPARVPSGPQEGLRLLAAEEDLAFDLLDMLDVRQLARATIAAQTTGDIHTRNDPAVGTMALAGLPATEMTAAQQRQLRQLLELYAGRMADDVAHRQLGRIEKAGFEQLHFGWAGAHRRGEPHYYRIHGPTVLVEYDNTQNNANHIHTVWRDLENDFGGDLLRRHYARQAHPH
jgi:hypothetical protein